jgi:hypothetical protein
MTRRTVGVDERGPLPREAALDANLGEIPL